MNINFSETTAVDKLKESIYVDKNKRVVLTRANQNFPLGFRFLDHERHTNAFYGSPNSIYQSLKKKKLTVAGSRRHPTRLNTSLQQIKRRRIIINIIKKTGIEHSLGH